ncbi:ATP-binding protein [Tunicatimonas pelagia]|uniref:ATP-binding protein n=1 Tax=Tunicatimonas pelagia TaxID=931531 RepID=UPI0026670560|nr:tetratricopeptide repeat-containing sensor histidine kinase [Tunicatimonas pelagia]WKN45837.1 tetratricopeptide repeat-containing sensor histidine kinase [Tunicatimonas pelagia]
MRRFIRKILISDTGKNLSIVLVCLVFVLSGTKTTAQPTNLDSIVNLYFQSEATKRTNILLDLRENPQQMLAVGQRIKWQAQELGIPDTLAQVDYNLAFAYYNQGRYDSVIQVLSKVTNVIREDDRSSSHLANMLNLTGIAYYLKGQHVESLKCFYEALAIWEEKQFNKGLSKLITNIGNVYYYREEYHKAVKYYERSLDICLAIQDTAKIIHLYSNIGMTWNKNLNRSDSAMAYYQRALEWAKVQDDEYIASIPLIGITNVQIKQGQLDSALINAKHILEIALSIQNINAKTSAWQLLAQVRGARNEYQSAIQAATEAYKLAVTSQASLQISDLSRMLADYYAELGEFEKAHQYRATQVAHQDSIYSIEKSKIIANLEQAQADAKIKVLEKDNALKKGQIERQMIYTIGTSLVAVLLLGALILVYISYNYRKKLASQLEEQQEEIVTNNEQLIQMNDKLQQQQQQLQHQNQDLFSLNQLKDKLLSIISHDFRSPLNSLKGIINILDSDALAPEEIPQLFSTLSTTVDNTTNMLDNLLKWTRSQMSGVKVSPERVVLSEIMNEVVVSQTTTAEKKGVALLQDTKDSILVYADPEMVRLVVRNLISNAIKFTDQGGSITAKAQQQGGQVIVSVSDTGVGIQTKDIDKLFQLNNHTTYGTANEKGTGLGLVLCQEFTEANGGKIWVESEPSQGTTFFFTLLTTSEQFPKYVLEQHPSQTV